MFKDINQSEISEKTFGVGSLIVDHTGETYLVLPTDSYTYIRLLGLNTMTFISKPIEVSDTNFLTKDEARKLVTAIDPNATMTDFSFDAKGLKFLKGAYV